MISAAKKNKACKETESDEDGNAILHGVNRERLCDESTFEQRLTEEKEKVLCNSRQKSNAQFLRQKEAWGTQEAGRWMLRRQW